MWNTCQAHTGQNPNNFLPWHRMYVLFMENIIRQVSGHPEFAMPYWNYTSYDPAQRGIVPVQFRLPTDPVYGVLYRANRTKLANTGQVDPGQPDHRRARSQCGDGQDRYSNVGKVQGFCRALDSGVHSRLHVLTGTAKNMGSVPVCGARSAVSRSSRQHRPHLGLLERERWAQPDQRRPGCSSNLFLPIRKASVCRAS